MFVCVTDSSDSQPALHYLRRTCVAASSVAWSGVQWVNTQVNMPIADGCAMVGPELRHRRQENE